MQSKVETAAGKLGSAHANAPWTMQRANRASTFAPPASSDHKVNQLQYTVYSAKDEGHVTGSCLRISTRHPVKRKRSARVTALGAAVQRPSCQSCLYGCFSPASPHRCHLNSQVLLAAVVACSETVCWHYRPSSGPSRPSITVSTPLISPVTIPRKDFFNINGELHATWYSTQ